MVVEPNVHRSLAIDANNATWDILRRPVDEISAADAEEMTRRAYAAAYHWQRAQGVTPANAARADWLLSRVWAVRNQGALALAHANRCLQACESAALADFDLAYAHEAVARSHACLGHASQARHHRELAAKVPIADADDKALVDSDIASGPWFGMT
ncbi:MAG: hypothetical protein KGP12_04070 [Actinomycetales bacterium]|nr:hypothetical protein [Actinomycetales bacterium]